MLLRVFLRQLFAKLPPLRIIVVLSLRGSSRPPAEKRKV